MRKKVISDEESGQGTVEYALVLIILSILGIAAWREVGGRVIEMLTGATDIF